MRSIVEDTTARYESQQSAPWQVNLPPDTFAGLLNAIVGFEIEITEIETKFKLGQNRSAEDQAEMLRRLQQMDDPASRELADFITRQRDPV